MTLRHCGYFLTIFLMFCPVHIFGQNGAILKKLKNIELMKATRSDVEAIFGKPKDANKTLMVSYETEYETLWVEYSRGICSENKKEGWNVVEGTVTGLSLYTIKDFLLDDVVEILELDLKTFRSYEVSDQPNIFEYENDVLGLSFSLEKPENKIQGVTFYPATKYDNLFCKNFSH